MYRFRTLLLAWTVISLGQPCAASGSPSGWSQFVQAFSAYATAEKVVGGSAILLEGGRVVARLNHGYADREGKRRVTEQTIFHWASITKTLTAIAIMQLRDRGKLNLDDPVTRWVPELRLMHDPFGAVDQVTVRMLLTHSAGLQAPTWPWKKGLPWEPFEPTAWEQLVAMLPYQEFLFKPGSRFSYSNPGFIYLARIIEKLTGEQWPVYIQKNIFAPLGLWHSYFGTTPYHLALARSHSYTVRRAPDGGMGAAVDNGPDFDPGITIPNGGWNAPLSDLASYLAFLLDSPPDKQSGAFYRTVLSRSTLQEMWRPALGVDGFTSFDWVGFSFFLRKSDGISYVGHTGHQAGFQAFMYFNPGKRRAVVWVLNTSNEDSSLEEEAQRRSLISAATKLLE